MTGLRYGHGGVASQRGHGRAASHLLSTSIASFGGWPPGRARECQTASVSFHESFWVTVGAAAPVIALASVVSIADLMGARDRVSHNLPIPSPTLNSEWLDSEFIRAGRLLIGAYLVGIINGALQMVALSMALQSLADSDNVVPTIIPRIMVPLGIFLLLVSISMTVSLRTIQRHVSHHLSPGPSRESVDLPDVITAVAHRCRARTPLWRVAGQVRLRAPHDSNRTKREAVTPARSMGAP